jgi:hypothetical protein
MLADDVLKETSNDPQKYSNYRPGPNADEILSAYTHHQRAKGHEAGAKEL